MKLLKCLYYQQKKYKLLTILGKPSLQIVDNSSMIGTGFHSYNEYGDIIKNFKEEKYSEQEWTSWWTAF